jgi:hypothetical protein
MSSVRARRGLACTEGPEVIEKIVRQLGLITSDHHIKPGTDAFVFVESFVQVKFP